ncbi:hypothetical protein N7495_007776 [Penicillium taxi]|uniref:uncharacterized protein n=1 Tax=Penicillium taxi TaxID=168475 RepID=UPI0025458785|nr:uncharacterized protein N7495_007776 [Penicillium taxi]KAJ5887735.1 hypothetical protein N7495_007776 [Penicillium taxi]
MSTSFLSLPAELRNEIYTCLLVYSEPIDPWGGNHGLEPNLLATNSKILHEARSLLYGNNRFDLTVMMPDLISRFLDTIGFINASHLQCIRIDFPRLHVIEDEVSLEEDSFYILEKIQSHCTNLKTLITSSESTNALETVLDLYDSPNICAKALALVAARFQEIPSLKEIVVEVYEEGPSLDIRRKMKSHGWIVNVVEPLEELEWDFDALSNDHEDDYDDYDDYDDDDDDDYDIDNDSDFWRRAAD